MKKVRGKQDEGQPSPGDFGKTLTEKTSRP